MAKPSFDVTGAPQTDVQLVTDTKVEQQLEAYLEVCAQIDQLKARKDQMQADLAKKHAKYGDKFETEEYLSTQVQSANSHISREELARLGVKPTIIEKATKRTPYSYVKVTRKKATAIDPVRATVRRLRKENGKAARA